MMELGTQQTLDFDLESDFFEGGGGGGGGRRIRKSAFMASSIDITL
jgi:hypothetical protein